LTEERILWVLIANELCPTTRRLMRAVGTEDTPDPTTDAIRRIVYGEHRCQDFWREFSPESTLRRYEFIARTDARSELPEHRQTWKVARRVLALVHGEVSIDEQLLALAERVTAPVKPIGALELAGDAQHRIESAFERGGVVLVHGRVGQGRRSALLAVAAAHGKRVVKVHTRSVAKERDAAQRQLRLIARECRLLDLTPLFCDLDALGGSNETADRLDLIEQEVSGLVLATSAKPISRRWKRAPSTVDLGALGGAQRASLWARALPMASAEDTEILATMYPLAPALIEATAQAAIEQSAGAPMKPEHITEGLRSVLDDRLAGLATRINATQTWQDLVLPDDQLTAVVELLARIRERRRVYEDWGFAEKLGKGLGVSALFSGPPGTGKTMAAGLIARTLNAELYQVDLSKIVSKWIGETEKNLATLFDAAEAGHAILLFDEADALFGKRTDVRSSNDRHANQEVNFLLQRLESYAGICILTTNHETAIDEAFRRRLAVHVRLPMPEVDERRKLWHALIPAKCPKSGDLRIDELANRFVMSGGYIKNAVLRAAFLAADEEGTIDAVRLSRAAQLEYEAMGKLVASPAL
jgi:ATP-dependent 26S proteasome regulatory subunit